jgi:nucleoside-diphosphate-sugar epimerase
LKRYKLLISFIIFILFPLGFGVYGQTQEKAPIFTIEVDGIIRLLMAPAGGDIHTPVNIGNPHELTVLQIAQNHGTDLLRKPNYFRALPEDDPKVRRPDIARAQKLLGWSPSVPLEEGLRLP